MKILHLTPADYKTAAWSGGTTTEIFIWPENASYAAREFAFRISSAVVELEESDFTALPGVERYITPLSGGFTLTHPAGESVVMGPMDAPYGFSGEIPTHCVGKATDFNLMLKGCRGKMEKISGKCLVLPGFHGFYATENGEISINGKRFLLAAGDFLAVFSREAMAAELGGAVFLSCWADI